MIELAPLLLVFPILGYLFNALVGRKFVTADREIGERWAGWVAAGMSLLSFGISVGILFSLMEDSTARVIPLFDWIYIPSAEFRVQWALHIDTLSSVMLMVITGVGSLIHIYAIGYMHGDGQFARFFAYLNLFLFFMLMLVTGSSYLVLFLGWEGVGLASFLLIGFWWQKDKMVLDPDRDKEYYEGVVNSNAARKAFVANRFGDLCMIVAMGLTFWTFGTLNYGTEASPGVFQIAVEAFEHGDMVHIAGQELSLAAVLSAITALFLLGAAGKSAQIPFFVWLPDAMAGPTPVSALMHAATMVTSGIYLLVRSNVLLEIVRESHYEIFGFISSPDLIAYTGAITAVYAGLIAFTQFDIKKVLAYSTVSQLGFMIAAVGMGAYIAAMFHLVTHAFFKALLFMGAGSVIHGMEHGEHHLHEHHGHGDHHGDHHDDDHHDDFDPQDMRYMGNLRKHMPITFVTYMIGALALAGIFPFAGFWSKDEILAHAGANGFGGVNILLTIAAFCTAFYMGRQLKMTFFGKERHEATKHVPESVPVMTRPLIILAALAIVGGAALNLPFFSDAAAEAAGMHVAETGDDGHAEEAEDSEHGDSAETEDDHSAEMTDDAHADDGHSSGESVHFTQPNLWLEHYLEPSIASFELTEEKIVHMPHTPIVLDMGVAGLSTVLAVTALVVSFFFVYGKTPQKATDKDPIFKIPFIFSFMSILPINYLYMKILRPAFNRFAAFAAYKVDWDFWHDWFHNNILRRGFYAVSDFLSNVFDREVIDGGMVLGTGRMIEYISNAFKQIQSGLIRNYALSLFIGVVALLVYFVFMA